MSLASLPTPPNTDTLNHNFDQKYGLGITLMNENGIKNINIRDFHREDGYFKSVGRSFFRHQSFELLNLQSDMKTIICELKIIHLFSIQDTGLYCFLFIVKDKQHFLLGT